MDLSTLNKFLKNGNTRDYKNQVPPARGVGNIHRLQGHILPHSNTDPVQEIPMFSCLRSILPIQSTPVWSVHSTHRIHGGGKEGQTNGFTQGYKNPQVPRRLVGQSQIPPNLSPAYTNSRSSVSGTRLDDKPGKIRTVFQTSLRLHRLPVRPEGGLCQIHPRALADLKCKNTETTLQTNLSRLVADVPDRLLTEVKST